MQRPGSALTIFVGTRHSERAARYVSMEGVRPIASQRARLAYQLGVIECLREDYATAASGRRLDILRRLSVATADLEDLLAGGRARGRAPAPRLRSG